jgi:murein DD-endopeptidase MepM/ murein hydrolase activator NlpD
MRLRTRRGGYNKFRVAVALGLALVVLILLVMLFRVVFPPMPPEPFRPEPAEAAVAPAPPPPELVEDKIVIPAGSNLAELLKRRGFTDREIHDLGEAVKPVYDLGRIRAGQELRLASLPEGPWRRLEYDIDEARFLVVRNGDPGVRAEIRYVPIEFKPAIVTGVIEDSLIAALNKAGEQDSLAIDLVERCFGWDIDFNTDLRKGDTFRIFVEKRFLDGRFAGYRDILAAEFVNEGRVYRAFRFTYPDTQASDYFDEKGGSRRKDFLRSPIKFARITSRFSASRLHPIYKIYRPHYGVDYAAPVGTPVQATDLRRKGIGGRERRQDAAQERLPDGLSSPEPLRPRRPPGGRPQGRRSRRLRREHGRVDRTPPRLSDLLPRQSGRSAEPQVQTGRSPAQGIPRGIRPGSHAAQRRAAAARDRPDRLGRADPQFLILPPALVPDPLPSRPPEPPEAPAGGAFAEAAPGAEAPLETEPPA